jgi:hypothetical protein
MTKRTNHPKTPAGPVISRSTRAIGRLFEGEGAGVPALLELRFKITGA